MEQPTPSLMQIEKEDAIRHTSHGEGQLPCTTTLCHVDTGKQAWPAEMQL